MLFSFARIFPFSFLSAAFSAPKVFSLLYKAWNPHTTALKHTKSTISTCCSHALLWSSSLNSTLLSQMETSSLYVLKTHNNSSLSKSSYCPTHPKTSHSSWLSHASKTPPTRTKQSISHARNYTKILWSQPYSQKRTTSPEGICTLKSGQGELLFIVKECRALCCTVPEGGWLVGPLFVRSESGLIDGFGCWLSSA